MTNLPALGPRGEGWVAIQVVIFAWIGWSGWLSPSGIGGAAAPLVLAAGGALIATGAVLAVAGVLALERNDALTAVPHPRDDARLVETGVYGLVRHPIYGGLVVAGLGWSIVRGSVPALLGTLVLLAFFDLKRRREEAWLAGHFAAYPAYRARTRRLIPWIY